MSWRTQSRGRGQPFRQNRQIAESPSVRGGRRRGGRRFVRVNATHRPLDLFGLQKLAEDSTERADVMRKFNARDYGLGAFLDDHKADFDCLEFVFVVLGNFCCKNGPTQFTDGFFEIVQILRERQVFEQVASVVMHLPNSRAKISTTKSERLKQLITGVYHLSIETLVLMPSFACTFLGRNFYQDLLFLKDMPSIKTLNLEEAVFHVLLEGVPRLEDAWNQHSVVDKKQNEEEAQYEERVRRQVRDELVKLQLCHSSDRQHAEFKCRENYMRSCSVGHPCPKKCFAGTGKILCRIKVEQAKCTHPCDRRMDCGHLCTLKCHVKTDPDHEQYKCMKQCESSNRNCHRNHRCGRKGYEECQLCPVNWKRKLTCGHSLVLPCHLSDEDAQSYCKVNVRKTITECGHSIDVQCGYKPTRADCKERCSLKLECGHDCVKKCCDPCTPNYCAAMLRLDSTNFCGHPITIPCQEMARVDVTLYEVKKLCLLECNEECTAILDCEHLCRGTCGSCFNGRFHVPCQQKCGRILVCGHSCKVNCTTSCPPCAEQCDNRCQHNKCTRKCSEPCVECKEPCGWRCDHYKCSRRCYEPCDRPRCDLPCSKKIDKCGHPCVGLCGELCPPLCRICDFTELTEFMLSMSEDDPDARFVYLADCGHTIEVSALDTWMLMENEENGIRRKCCPRCQTVISSCLRYGDVIKKNFEDIVLVKKKIFGVRQHPQEFAKTVEIRRAEIRQVDEFVQNFVPWPTVKHPIIELFNATLSRYEQVVTPPNGKYRQHSLDGEQRYKIQVTLDVIDRMCKLINKIQTTSVQPEPDLVDDLLFQLHRIYTSFHGRNRICNQEYRELIGEIERLDLIRAYYSLLCSPCYSPGCPAVPKLALIKRNLMEDVTKLDDSRKTETTKLLEEAAVVLKSSLGINKEEKEQILKAMYMKQGHWFKCPNGHVYVIGDCGGATVESTCNECGAKIGGGSHRLRHDNRLASEMDGATRGAWPGSLH